MTLYIARYADSGKPVAVGDKVEMPYHGKATLTKVDVYGPGEWSNFRHKDKPCIVVTYDIDDMDRAAEDLALSQDWLDDLGIVIEEAPLEDQLKEAGLV